MKKYLYLSVMPEALIASMLPPEEFGNYLAVGTKKRTRGQAIFFEVDPDAAGDLYDKDYVEKECVPSADGTPKRSKYLAVYRVMERVPLDALKSLYLSTDDGRVLELKKEEYVPSTEPKLRLFQLLSPLTQRIATKYNAEGFVDWLTSGKQPVNVPKIFYADLMLDDLALDPTHGSVANLPYHNIDHLRDCLVELQYDQAKPTKTVIRYMNGDLPFRTIKTGFFIGDSQKIYKYTFPSKKELENDHYAWWRSALTMGIR